MFPGGMALFPVASVGRRICWWSEKASRVQSMTVAQLQVAQLAEAAYCNFMDFVSGHFPPPQKNATLKISCLLNKNPCCCQDLPSVATIWEVFLPFWMHQKVKFAHLLADVFRCHLVNINVSGEKLVKQQGGEHEP